MSVFDKMAYLISMVYKLISFPFLPEHLSSEFALFTLI